MEKTLFMCVSGLCGLCFLTGKADKGGNYHMVVGIIGAMDGEIKILKEAMQDIEEMNLSGRSFFRGTINGCRVIVVKCGIGKVNAAVAAEILCGGFRVDALINTGVAGGIDNRLRIGDIVLSTDLLQHDMDVTGLGYEPGVIPDQDTSVFEADEELRKLALSVADMAVPGLRLIEGRIVSGDQFISSLEKKVFLLGAFSGVCAEMEGAAIAQVAHMNHTPFLVIRAISDQADGGANIDYPTFLKTAEVNSSELVMEMLHRIANQ